MARKGQVAVQDNVACDEELEAYFEANKHKLICMEVYSDFCGPCLATAYALRKCKMELGDEYIAMVKASANNISILERFKDKSEPVFLFIVDHKLTRAMFGANGTELSNIIEDEINQLKIEQATGKIRPKLNIGDLLPEEKAKLAENKKIEEEYRENAERLRVLTLAARKKRVNERLSRSLQIMNFILFWPHCHQAHYDLYEKWDMINVSVAAKDEIQLTEDVVKEVLYMSDVQPNEACVYALMKGPALAVLFKMSESDIRDFIKLMRYTLYEEIPIPKEDMPPEKQLPPIPAYERYATISKTARQVRRMRYNEKLAKLAKEKEEAERLAAEQARLAKEAEEERLFQEKQRQEEERMARIAAGLPAEPEPEPKAEGEEEIEPEELVEGEGEAREGEGVVEEQAVVKEEREEVFNSDQEIEDEEYIPPGGLFVPGLYSPPNELAKANGLRVLFPKHVTALAGDLETEYLPPHVLVMFPIDKRFDVMEIAKAYKDEILNYGIFVGDDPYTAQHVAYTVKQYAGMSRMRRHLDRMAVMVSRKRSLPLLQLAGLNPCYISSDVVTGERECLAMFPVGYGDDYYEEPSIVEEEEVVVQVVDEAPPQPEGEEGQPTEPQDNEDEDEKDD